MREKGIFTWLSVPNKSHIWILLVLGILVLLFPIIFRMFTVSGALIGAESYDNLNWAEKNSFSSLKLQDFSNDPYFGERGWFVVLSLAPLFLSKWLPFLLGILSFMLFYLIVNKIQRGYSFLATLLLIFSPISIYLFSTSTKYCAALFLSLLVAYYYLNSKRKLALLIFFLTSFFSFLCAIFLFLIYLFYVLYNKRGKSIGLVYTILLLVSSFIVQFGYLLYYIGSPSQFFMIDFTFLSILGNLFTDLGSICGFGAFFFIISLFGIFYKYKEKYHFYLVYCGLILLLVMSVYFGFLLFYLNIILAFFVAVGISRLILIQWKADVVKKLVILFLICGLIFSFISYTDRFASSYPTKDVFKAMKFLKNEGGTGVVLSDPSRAGFIRYGNNIPLVSNDVLFYQIPEQRLSDISWFYTLSNYENAEEVITKYNVTLIWIDKEMRNKLWNGNDEEILSLMKYGFQKFFNAYASKEINIWEYMPDVEAN